MEKNGCYFSNKNKPRKQSTEMYDYIERVMGISKTMFTDRHDGKAAEEEGNLYKTGKHVK
jgi:hypothetical protein